MQNVPPSLLMGAVRFQQFGAFAQEGGIILTYNTPSEKESRNG